KFIKRKNSGFSFQLRYYKRDINKLKHSGNKITVCFPILINSKNDYLTKFIFFSHFCISFCTCFSFSPSITNKIPSLSTPPLVENPSNTLLLGHNCFTVSKLLPMP